MVTSNEMTREFLRSAYGGESMAHMRYITWGDQATKEGFPNVGRLFEAIAHAERVHAENHFEELKEQSGDYSVTSGAIFGRGELTGNLEGAIAGELHEVQQMYPVYLQAAELQGEKGARRAFHYALESEKIHATLFQHALEAVRQGEDLVFDAALICPVCGHTVLDEPPDRCPICGTMGEKYHSY